MQPIKSISRSIRPGFFSRTFSSCLTRRAAWTPGPSPPKLPKEEQEIFEKLQQQSTGAFSTPKYVREHFNADKEGGDVEGGVERAEAQSSSSEADRLLEQLREKARLAAKGDGEELHPNVRRGAAPEFDGDTNPKTGEVGGPKNEPLRWGVSGDWSYNGRVTDF